MDDEQGPAAPAVPPGWFPWELELIGERPDYDAYSDDELWEMLVEDFGDGHPVERLWPGRLRTVIEGSFGRPIERTLIADPQAWAAFVRADNVPENGVHGLFFMPDDDEVFIILTDDGFVCTVREELPAVPGTAWARLRASGATLRWEPYAPAADQAPPSATPRGLPRRDRG